MPLLERARRPASRQNGAFFTAGETKAPILPIQQAPASATSNALAGRGPNSLAPHGVTPQQAVSLRTK